MLLSDYLQNFVSSFTWDNFKFMATMFAGATLLSLIIEGLLIGKKSTLFSIFKSEITGDLICDIFIWLMEILLVWPFFGKCLTLSVGAIVGNYLNNKVQGIVSINIIGQIPNYAVQVIVSLMLGDLMLYALHRAFHKYTPFWHLHKFHHSAVDMTVFTASRDNPVVGQIWLIATGLPSAIFGSAKEIPQIVTFVVMLHNMLIHSRLDSDWGLIGRFLVISPHAHKIHHSRLHDHENMNFGFLSPLWDHMFGTFYDGQVSNVSKLGIKESSISASPIRNCIDNFIILICGIWISMKELINFSKSLYLCIESYLGYKSKNKIKNKNKNKNN